MDNPVILTPIVNGELANADTFNRQHGEMSSLVSRAAHFKVTPTDPETAGVLVNVGRVTTILGRVGEISTPVTKVLTTPAAGQTRPFLIYVKSTVAVPTIEVKQGTDTANAAWDANPFTNTTPSWLNLPVNSIPLAIVGTRDGEMVSEAFIFEVGIQGPIDKLTSSLDLLVPGESSPRELSVALADLSDSTETVYVKHGTYETKTSLGQFLGGTWSNRRLIGTRGARHAVQPPRFTTNSAVGPITISADNMVFENIDFVSDANDLTAGLVSITGKGNIFLNCRFRGDPVVNRSVFPGLVVLADTADDTWFDGCEFLPQTFGGAIVHKRTAASPKRVRVTNCKFTRELGGSAGPGGGDEEIKRSFIFADEPEGWVVTNNEFNCTFHHTWAVTVRGDLSGGLPSLGKDSMLVSGNRFNLEEPNATHTTDAVVGVKLLKAVGVTIVDNHFRQSGVNRSGMRFIDAPNGWYDITIRGNQFTAHNADSNNLIAFLVTFFQGFGTPSENLAIQGNTFSINRVESFQCIQITVEDVTKNTVISGNSFSVKGDNTAAHRCVNVQVSGAGRHESFVNSDNSIWSDGSSTSGGGIQMEMRGLHHFTVSGNQVSVKNVLGFVNPHILVTNSDFGIVSENKIQSEQSVVATVYALELRGCDHVVVVGNQGHHVNLLAGIALDNCDYITLTGNQMQTPWLALINVNTNISGGLGAGAGNNIQYP